MSSQDLVRIAGFLAADLKPSQVAAIVNCTPAYISQLQAQEDFKALIKEEKEKLPKTEEAVLDAKYLSVEHKILNHIEAQLPFAEVPALTRALEVVTNRQDKRALRAMVGANGGTNLTVSVSLTLPAHAIPECQLNERNEVIALNGKPMAPLSSEGVKALFDTRSGKIPEGRILEHEVSAHLGEDL